MSNSIDPDQTAHHEPSHLDLCCLQKPIFIPLGRPLCWWPCYHRWIAWGMCQEALDMERSNGEERTEGKCRKDKDYDLRYGTGSPAEFRRVSMRCLSHRSGQLQHLLQWLQALGAQEMQWAQALEKTLTTDVHGARELHAPWMADHRRKSRSDLTSLRFLFVLRF